MSVQTPRYKVTLGNRLITSGYKVCWGGDTREVECKFFRRRGEAERFAAARSEFNEHSVSVHEWNPIFPPDRWMRGMEPWLTIYRHGWLKDSQKKGAFVPERHKKFRRETDVLIENQRRARRGARHVRDISDERFRYEEHAARHENDSFARGQRSTPGRSAGQRKKLTAAEERNMLRGTMKQVIIQEGLEATNVHDATEMYAWDLGYQGRQLPAWLIQLGKIERVDVEKEWRSGVAAAAE